MDGTILNKKYGLEKRVTALEEGASTYSFETLYSNAESISSCPLSKPITNYKMIGVRFLRTNNLEVFNLYPVDYLLKLKGGSNSTGTATNDKWCFFRVTDESTLTIVDSSDLNIYEVYGVNF